MRSLHAFRAGKPASRRQQAPGRAGAQPIALPRGARAGLMSLAVLAGSILMFWPKQEASGEAARSQETAVVTIATPRPAPARASRGREAPAWVADYFSHTVERRPLLTEAAMSHPLPLSELPSPVEPALQPAPRAAADPEDFTGIWAVNERACTPQVGREGFLPTIINAQGAWAGETTCAFGAGQRDGNSWTFPTVCSDPTKKWKSDVHLTVDGRRLTWKSQSGARTYVRCEQRPGRSQVALSTPR